MALSLHTSILCTYDINIHCHHQTISQYGCGKPGGGTELSFGVKAMLDGTEGTMIANVDIENGYNGIMHSAIIKQVWKCTELRGTYFFFKKILSQNSYIGLGSGAHVRMAPFTCKEGIQQGAVEASFLFCVGTNMANPIRGGSKYRDR
eukprot:1290124-Ditylum_brightwellii.AAC.1